MTFAPGDTLLDKYRIETLLGQGSYGQVYLVTYLPLNQPRALKVLRRAGATAKEFEKAQERFTLEAQLGGQLNSPNPNPHLLMIYEPILNEEMAGIVMEYAPGGSLAKRIQQAREQGRPIPVAQALQIALDVAEGLEALHDKEIIHRDLKPANILFDQHSHARLADLGLVQTPDDNSHRLELSRAQAHPGTPGYMSPEQETSTNPLKPPSDIYALGLVLFEMLTGKLDYNQRPGTRASKLRTDLPGQVDDLLARTLSKDPEERPWDGAEAAGLLREAREKLNRGAAKAESPASTPGEAEKEWEQTPEVAQIRARTEAAGKALLAAKTARLEAERLAQEAEAVEAARQQAAAEAVAVEKALEAEKAARLDAERRLQAAQKVRLATAALEVLQLAPGVNMQFVRVPAGEFLMGSDPKKDKQASGDEQPQHKVYLPEYRIGKYPVTNGQYAAFVQAAGVQKPAHWAHGEIPKDKREHPVVNVSWKDASAFCAWLSKVSGQQVGLPSEAEWEKAARGTDGRVYPWGNQAPDAQRCNFNNNVKDTTPVGKYSPQGDSPYLCADMAGNVWEWTHTIWDDKFKYPYKIDDGREDLRQENAYHTLRGGAFGNYIVHARCACHLGDYPDHRNSHYGFRVMLSPVLLS